MEDIAHELTKPEKLVMNACAGCLCVAKACVLLPKHCIFIGCEEDPIWVSVAMQDLIMLYARQMLSRKFHIDWEEEISRSVEVYVKAVREVEAQKRLDLWKIPGGLRSTQTFTLHILYYSSTYYGE